MAKGQDLTPYLKQLPDSPGVYFMKDAAGKILYVGKASSLKRRVASYFQKSRVREPRIDEMVGRVASVDWVPTGSEEEALIYEAHLVKVHQPPYNVMLRDDKSYPMLKLTVNDPYPQLLITRKRKDDGALYYGPFAHPGALRRAVGVMRKMFPLRTCKKLPKNVCLMYHLGQCLGPCEKLIGGDKYRGIVEEQRLFLEGRRDELVKDLSRRMEEAASRQEFEEAARLRDVLYAMTRAVSSLGRERLVDQLVELKTSLGLPSLPVRVEAFDISNIFGTWAVGSMVQFVDGRPNKDGYRRFKIESVEGIDDYRMIREVVRRRYARVLEEHEPLPNLILIDGGAGHLSSALRELKALGLERVPAIGLAKEFEHIYFPGRDRPLALPPTSGALHLLQRVRNEAHRFAVTYHRILRKKGEIASELEGIAGIGARRRRILLQHFGSVENIRRAHVETVAALAGIGRACAETIAGYFRAQRHGGISA